MKHIPRKRFGQHFLVDRFVIESIVDCIEPQPLDALVEIGPGLGAMTNPVVQRSRQLTVIELDRDLAARLRQRSELNVIEADVLNVDFTELSARLAKPLRIIGNLPYNISTPILFHLMGFVDAVQDQHFMLQKEVVNRMVASPSTKDYGRLSVMLQWRYEMDDLLDVPPEAFDPPPRVNSAIIRMKPRAAPHPVDPGLLKDMVAAAFSQRRKLLRHTLGPWLQARAFPGTFDLQRRAEEVPVQEYLDLVTSLPRVS